MDTYEFVTNKIIEAMEQGVNPWRMPWRIDARKGSVDMPYWSRKGKGYSFLNCMLLAMQGKSGGEFITLKQANAEGGKVKKGARSAVVVFWCLGYNRKGTDAQGNEITEHVQYHCPVLKQYRVFSVDDCEGLKVKPSEPAATEPENTPDPIEEGERLLTQYLTSEGAPKFSTGSNDAYYRPSEDAIKVPALQQYTNAAEYYSTAFHECVHSTGHPSRLDRNLKGSFRGSEEYAAEELVAEIGSAYLCAAAGIDDDEAFNNSAAYLQGWAKRLKDDKKLFPVAAARAEKAARYILGEREN